MVATEDSLDMATASVSDIALYLPHSIEILKKYDLDFCCNGKNRFEDACRKSNLNPEEIWQELLGARVDSSAEKGYRFETWNLPLLIDFIIQNHHQYVRESIPEIRQLLEKVCSVHGIEVPSLNTIREDFNSLAEELLAHLPKEEEILFPAIKASMQQVESPGKRAIVPGNPDGYRDNATISVLEHEHESAGNLIKSIRSLSDHYTPPSFACPTYQLAFKKLKEFDDDLMQHIHLENNILFPKAQSIHQKS